jgi:virginiamycin B lyase
VARLGGSEGGMDGALWLTDMSSGESSGLWRLPTDGGFTHVAVPTPDGQPFAITAGPDGNIWFTEYQAGKIGRASVARIPRMPVVLPVDQGRITRELPPR